MKIDSSYYLNKLLEAQLTSTTNSTTEVETSTTNSEDGMDAYIPSNSEDEILYANYDDILTAMTPPPMPPASMTDTEDSTDSTDSTTESELAVSDSVQSIISNISETMHCQEGTVLDTLQSLGLTPEDLLDSDNIETVANALNEGAIALGIPTVDDLDQTISDLKSSVEDTVSTLESDYSLTDEELAAIIEQLKTKPLNDTTLSELLSSLGATEETEA
ncbi:hypothetical protein C8E03_103299 [Lachnotalea glycerini]|uniref:Uncharacterized protein n=1 Tax=Lachnotalea glycerini TaxID=1763509 RepID=A0A318EQT2_9FIRM|nr:hypothetical protein [Lachnotalea glycerini]PXV91736.1 hypothetical protein C8E03_103299 [Lachnotalea glycerini]